MMRHPISISVPNTALLKKSQAAFLDEMERAERAGNTLPHHASGGSHKDPGKMQASDP